MPIAAGLPRGGRPHESGRNRQPAEQRWLPPPRHTSRFPPTLPRRRPASARRGPSGLTRPHTLSFDRLGVATTAGVSGDSGRGEENVGGLSSVKRRPLEPPRMRRPRRISPDGEEIDLFVYVNDGGGARDGETGEAAAARDRRAAKSYSLKIHRKLILSVQN